MNIPDEFEGRVCKTQLKGITNLKKVEKILKEWPGSEADVVYEKDKDGEPKSIIVIVFESTADCLAFKLKYGNEYR